MKSCRKNKKVVERSKTFVTGCSSSCLVIDQLCLSFNTNLSYIFSSLSHFNFLFCHKVTKGITLETLLHRELSTHAP